MKKLLIFLLLIASASYAQKKKAIETIDPLNGIEKELNQILNDQKVAGFAVAIVKNDSIIYAKGFGYRDFENKLPVTVNTLFPIASCSKAFTASLMGLMKEEGALEYDKPARDYLPKLKFFNKNMDDNITVRDLILHRTGLPRHDQSRGLFNTASRDTLLSRIAFQEPTAGLGKTWQYNNLMYLVQGMIAEKHYGKTWEELIKEKIFVPLKMERSNASVVEYQKDADFAYGYSSINNDVVSKAEFRRNDVIGPAGSINSNVLDMGNWLKMWINKGEFKGSTILTESYIDEAMSSQIIISPALPSAQSPGIHFLNYGFGWFVSSYRGHYRVEHGGNLEGFTSSMALYPSDNLGIIVLSNQHNSHLSSIVRNTIADRILNVSYIDWNSRFKKEGVQKEENGALVVEKKNKDTKPSHNLKDYVGLYTNGGYGTFEVIQKQDSLIAIFPTDKYWLQHYHFDVFAPRLIDKSGVADTTSGIGVPLSFQTSDIGGEIYSASIQLEEGLKPMIFTRSDRVLEITENDLEKYVGVYEFAPQDIVRFYIKDKKLYMFVEGQPEYEMALIDEHKFGIKVLNGYSALFSVDSGVVSDCKLIEPDGIYTAKKIK